MSTRASIKFTDADDTYFVYRRCDGFPDEVLADINSVIVIAKGRWSGSEAGQLVALFFAYTGDANMRLQHYELTSCVHGDESYEYLVDYDESDGTWKAEVVE